MEQKIKVLVTFVLLVVLVTGFWMITKAITTYTGYSIAVVGDVEGFTKCLTDSGAELYIKKDYLYCDNQKEIFGDSVKYLKIIDCTDDPEKLCSKNEIKFVPTWLINEEKHVGEKSFEELSKLTGCELIK